MTAHLPLIPEWTCAGCGSQWPCPTRRRELLAEYHAAPVSLDIHLRTWFAHAAQDLVWVPAGWLHRRFVGWTR